ncbi:MAG: hypothetical protein ABI197_06475 [Granulicella sp.]
MKKTDEKVKSDGKPPDTPVPHPTAKPAPDKKQDAQPSKPEAVAGA